MVLETARTLLRPLEPGDALYFFELNNDPEVIKYTGDRKFHSLAEARDFVVNYDQYIKYGTGRFAVVDKVSLEFLGWCGLKYSPELEEYDLGFRFNRRVWNRGFATETAEKILHYGFNDLELDIIVGRAMKQNIASIKVLEKLGMKFTGTFDFELHEGHLYSITRKDFNGLFGEDHTV